MILDDLNAYGGGDMDFASARTAYEDHVLRPVHELAAVQLTRRGFIDLAGGEVEVRQIFIGGERADFM